MWAGEVLMGVALLCTLLVGVSVGGMQPERTAGGGLAMVYLLSLMAVLWVVLGAVLLVYHGGRAGVPAGFVLAVYVLGFVAEVASLLALAERTTDRAAALGLRAGMILIPLVLVLFAGSSM